VANINNEEQFVPEVEVEEVQEIEAAMEEVPVAILSRFHYYISHVSLEAAAHQGKQCCLLE